MKKAALILFAFALAGCAQGPAAPRVAVTAPKVPIPPPPPRGEPDFFAGATAAKVKAALGEPVFVRKDGAIEMWRYDGAACHAFFFLYGAGAAQAVRHVETLPRGAASAADPACLNGLKKIS